MDTKTFILELFLGIYSQCDEAMDGVTDEFFNWKPPGTANPISAVLIHLLGAEDDFIQAAIQHQLPCWDAHDWSRKVGVDIPPMPGRGWKEFIPDRVNLTKVLAYQQDVRAATQAYLAHLTDEELERRVSLFGQENTVAGVLRLLVYHNAAHAGEIAVIKGIRGLQGWRF